MNFEPKKNHMVPENHRPISLLPVMSKIFEKLVLQRFKLHAKLRKEQHVFRPNYSTTTQLVSLLDDLAIAKNENSHSVAVIFDMEKVFDQVWLKGLLHKIHLISWAPIHLGKLINSFLTGRSFAVKIANYISSTSPKEIETGVPYGLCLSQLLYVLCINDFPMAQNINLSLFTDDIMFYSTCKNPYVAIFRLQIQINTAETWLEKWRLKLNIAKTVAALFGNKIPKRNLLVSYQ